MKILLAVAALVLLVGCKRSAVKPAPIQCQMIDCPDKTQIKVCWPKEKDGPWTYRCLKDDDTAYIYAKGQP